MPGKGCGKRHIEPLEDTFLMILFDCGYLLNNFFSEPAFELKHSISA